MPFVVQGAIRDEWERLGGENGFLGPPLIDETGAPDGRGRFNHFQGGSIYWTPETGAHEVHGGIRQKWAETGFERFLGYPLTDETGTPDGRGRFNHFRAFLPTGAFDASIYWTPETGAHEVHGGIRQKWADTGWERGLGYPLTDEMPQPDGVGRFQNFERGTIVWSPQTGAVEMPETVTLDSGSITSDLTIGGFAKLVMGRGGDFTFSGHLHDSGALGIKYVLTLIALTPSGLAYTAQRVGDTGGTFTSGPRDDDWTTPGSNDRIRDNWGQASQARLTWRLDANDTLTPIIGKALEDALQEAIKAAGQAAVAAVIALV